MELFEPYTMARLNPLLAPLSLIGTSFIISKLLQTLKLFNENFRELNIQTLKERYVGEWAFVAEVVKPIGRAYALTLAKNGYNIISLKTPGSFHVEVKAEVEGLGRKFEDIKIAPFCSTFSYKDC